MNHHYSFSRLLEMHIYYYFFKENMVVLVEVEEI